MNIHGNADRFEIVNGPEDGMAFPMPRSPIQIGVDPSCGVQVRLDAQITRIHARAMAVAEGYRIRSSGSTRVWVDGKRVGIVRSRIVRHGGIVRVGGTDLMLQTAPEGLAARSHGLAIENDFMWAMRLAVTGSWRTLRATVGFVAGNLWGFVKFLVPALILLAVFVYQPWVFHWLWAMIARLVWEARNFITGLF